MTLQPVLKATAVVLRNDRGTEEVLTIEHPLDEGDFMLQLPAGTVEPEEAPAATAVRELREETGVEAKVRCLAGIIDEEYQGQARRRWIFLLDAPGELPDEWACTCDCGAPIRCFWLPFETATLVEPQQPWIEVARAAR